MRKSKNVVILIAMSVLKKVTNFLFGKEPDIFDDQGRVLHKLPKKKWDDWQNRIVKGEDYNWRSHTGSQAGAVPQPDPAQNPTHPSKSYN